MADHVHLQGWGEPLLHPDLRSMVRDCRKSGCSVGITTNGVLLESALRWIVEESVDLVTVSVAGNPEVHAGLRGGSKLGRILEATAELIRLSTASSSGRKRGATRVQLSYLLTRDNSRHLPELVEMAARAGVAELFVIHLDCTPSSDLLREAAFDECGLLHGVAADLEAADRAARAQGIWFRGPALRSQELLTCALDPLRFAFVTAEGRVGPCVYGLLPISGRLPRWSHKGRHEIEQPCYGRLQHAGLKEILTGPDRKQFVRPFIDRLRAEKGFHSAISADFSVEALQRLEAADQLRSRCLSENPFPEACNGCHKALGW